MADERYEWLDEDAAERLLRGEPVTSLDGHRATEAERLAAALEAVARTARPATGELPGEAAALAAFRAAAHSGRVADTARSASSVPVNAGDPAAVAEASGYAEVAGHAGETGEPVTVEVLAPVRIHPAAGPPVPGTHAAGTSAVGLPAAGTAAAVGTPAAGAAASAAPSAAGSSAAGRDRARTRTRSPRRKRPVRFGLVASFAGCALGGVAMAATAGMLPGPFGGHAPAPATSVTADASPDGFGSQDVTGTHPPADPPVSPEAPYSAPRTGSSAPDGRGTGGSGEDAGPENGDGRRTGGGPDGPPDTGANGKAPRKPANGTSGRWYAEAVQACRDYRDGDLADDRRRALEAMAKGARNLERFCDRMLAEGGKGRRGQDGRGDQGPQRGPGTGDRTAGDRGEDSGFRGPGGDGGGYGRGTGAERNQPFPMAGLTTAPKRPPVTPAPRRPALPPVSPSASPYPAQPAPPHLSPTVSPSTVAFAVPPSAYRTAGAPAVGSPLA